MFNFSNKCISSLVLLTSCSKIENTKITESISENKPDSENNATRESNTNLNDNKDNKLVDPEPCSDGL
uniref:hypothetical protein n=1 Tax=Mycoplasmopsis bovis TaxID=28903 RepID=UPI003D27A0D8